MAISALEKVKLIKQLRDLRTEAAGLGAGPAAAVKKLKVAKAMRDVRAQLGLGAAPAPEPAETLAGAVSLAADKLNGRVASEKVMGVPESWIVMNAPRPLLGTQTLEGGPFLSGRFYAAIDPADSMAARYVEENRKLDACVVIFATKAQQIEMALIGNEYAAQYREEYKGDELYEMLNPLDKLRDKTAGELKALLAQVLAAPVASELSDEDRQKLADKRDMLEDFLRSRPESPNAEGWRNQIAEIDAKIGKKETAKPDTVEPEIDTSGWTDAQKAAYALWLEYKRRSMELALDGTAMGAFKRKIRQVAKTIPFNDEKAVFYIDSLITRVWGSDYDPKMAEIEFAEPASEPHPAIATLQKIASGGMDGSGEPLEVLQSLYDQISAAVDELNGAGLLTGEAEGAANAAITHWAELEEKLNG